MARKNNSEEIIHIFSNIKQIRKDRGLTQEEVADKIFIRRDTYNKMENGVSKITCEFVHKVAKVLNVRTRDIYELQKNSPAPNLNILIDDLDTLLIEIHSALYGIYAPLTFPYEEKLPYNELSKEDLNYVKECGIKDRQEYEDADIIVGYTPDDGSIKAFREMIADPKIRSLFEKNIIQDEFFIQLWTKEK